MTSDASMSITGSCSVFFFRTSRREDDLLWVRLGLHLETDWMVDELQDDDIERDGWVDEDDEYDELDE